MSRCVFDGWDRVCLFVERFNQHCLRWVRRTTFVNRWCVIMNFCRLTKFGGRGNTFPGTWLALFRWWFWRGGRSCVTAVWMDLVRLLIPFHCQMFLLNDDITNRAAICCARSRGFHCTVFWWGHRTWWLCHTTNISDFFNKVDVHRWGFQAWKIRDGSFKNHFSRIVWSTSVGHPCAAKIWESFDDNDVCFFRRRIFRHHRR